MKHTILAILAATAALAPGDAAQALDCPVHVLQAHQTAKARGWRFYCQIDVGSVGVTTHFVTYPPDRIGCVVKTPPVVDTSKRLPVTLNLFVHDIGLDPTLRNGWKLKSFEIVGAQWTPQPKLAGNSRVRAMLMEPARPAHTFNVQLSRMTLTHGGATTCGEAIEQAF